MASFEPLVEIRIPSVIHAGENPVFQAQILDTQVERVGIRYRLALKEQYRFIELERSAKDWLQAVIPLENNHEMIYYYVVLQKRDATVLSVLGTPENPKTARIVKKEAFVVHQVSHFVKEHAGPFSIKDRFGDDDIESQVSVFSARSPTHFKEQINQWTILDEHALESKIHTGPLAGYSEGHSDFRLFQSNGEIELSYRGTPIQNRFRLLIDGIETEDETGTKKYFTQNFNELEQVLIQDGPRTLLGLSGGFLATANVQQAWNRGFRCSSGTSWDEWRSGLSTGFTLGALHNYAFSNLLFRGQSRYLSSGAKTELWWDDSTEKPVAKGVMLLWMNYPESKPSRINWDLGLFINLPTLKNMHSSLSVFAAQSFSEYRTLSLKSRLESNINLEWQKLSFLALLSFSSVTNFETDPIFNSGICHVSGLTTNAFRNCRLNGAIAIHEEALLGSVAKVNAALEASLSSNQKNDLESLLSPSFSLQLAPNDKLNLEAGFVASVRSPTILENVSHAKAHPHSFLRPEKMKQFIFSLNFRYPMEYTLFEVQFDGRTGWIMDSISAIGHSNESENGETKRVSSIRSRFGVELAGGHRSFWESEFHPVDSNEWVMSSLLGAQIQIRGVGNLVLLAHMKSPESEAELRINNLNLIYQSKRIFQYFSVVTTITHVFSSASIGKNENGRFWLEVKMDL